MLSDIKLLTDLKNGKLRERATLLEKNSQMFEGSKFNADQFRSFTKDEIRIYNRRCILIDIIIGQISILNFLLTGSTLHENQKRYEQLSEIGGI